jgi:hypothetical protein
MATKRTEVNLMDKVTEHDLLTGEVTSRDMTTNEIEARAEKVANLVNRKEAQEAKKQEVLAKLGLTQDEVSALLA